MADVITLSSDDSDVEVVGSFPSKAEPLPLSAVRIDVDAVNVNCPQHYIDLSDPRWTLPELKQRKRQSSPSIALVDLTESDEEIGIERTEVLPPRDSPEKEESSNKNQTSNNQDFNLQTCSSRDSAAPQQDCGVFVPEKRCLNSQTQKQQDNNVHPNHYTPTVKLRRLPFLEKDAKELKESSVSVYLTKERTQNSLVSGQQDANIDAPECTLERPSESNGSFVTSSQHEFFPKLAKSLITQEQQENSNTFTNAQLHKLSDHSTHPSPINTLKSSELFDLDSLPHRSPARLDTKSPVALTPTSEHNITVENMLEWQSRESKDEKASNSSGVLCCSLPTEPALSVSEPEDNDEGSGARTYREDAEIDSPLSFLWQEGSDAEEVNEERKFNDDFRAASQEDRHFVCPVTMRKLMSGPYQALTDAEDEGFGTPEVLCRQSLSLVYSTIDENYSEGTLQLLSDLLQPSYYPPRDITTHLLRNILLDPQCPHHLCVQAYNLLMRTQRHHMADINTVPWDWELLTSVMANEDCTKRYRCEVVRMLLEYVVQTLEDNFQAKRSTSNIHHSIAKTVLSCDRQFPRVREVIKWLFFAIIKSTELGERRETVRERDEQIRIVSIFQRMLTLALEVDHSPALTSVKLSQELFHMLISNVPLRAHRMLLLESLQSKLLRCKLLEHLLDYACPKKISLPMSLSLLLHYMKNCTLAQDPTDGSEKWQRWEELVHLLWMLLLSYNKAMKGYLCSSATEQRGRGGMVVYKPDDKVSKPAIREAVDSFLSRAKADLGETLPLHVEESLTYLQDHLLDVCQF
ncbi:uncharacterized protein simc1 [Echeneis naucrates]|uniref:Uncharacterized protein n=1 Tax=Echeneis naucrates TaxID=173247 RepID=A0A665U552_ECHNA|nr:SUMO-interacting motif-containing protein 1 [Echeneis naucrates]